MKDAIYDIVYHTGGKITSRFVEKSCNMRKIGSDAPRGKTIFMEKKIGSAFFVLSIDIEKILSIIENVGGILPPQNN